MRLFLFALFGLLMAAPGHAAPPDIAEAAYGQVVQECRRKGGQPTMDSSFESIRDFNGDGTPDYFFDFGRFQCRNIVFPNCTQAGCRLVVFMSTPAGHRKAYDGMVRGFSFPFPRGGAAVLLLSLQGSECGLAGSEECQRRLVWNGRAMVLPGPNANQVPGR
jgi:hypothetical protein